MPFSFWFLLVTVQKYLLYHNAKKYVLFYVIHIFLIFVKIYMLDVDIIELNIFSSDISTA